MGMFKLLLPSLWEPGKRSCNASIWSLTGLNYQTPAAFEQQLRSVANGETSTELTGARELTAPSPQTPLPGLQCFSQENCPQFLCLRSGVQFTRLSRIIPPALSPHYPAVSDTFSIPHEKWRLDFFTASCPRIIPNYHGLKSGLRTSTATWCFAAYPRICSLISAGGYLRLSLPFALGPFPEGIRSTQKTFASAGNSEILRSK